MQVYRMNGVSLGAPSASRKGKKLSPFAKASSAKHDLDRMATKFFEKHGYMPFIMDTHENGEITVYDCADGGSDAASERFGRWDARAHRVSVEEARKLCRRILDRRGPVSLVDGWYWRNNGGEIRR